MSESLADTLTYGDSVPRASWEDICFENQLLHLLEINVLAGLLTYISKGLFGYDHGIKFNMPLAKF